MTGFGWPGRGRDRRPACQPRPPEGFPALDGRLCSASATDIIMSPVPCPHLPSAPGDLDCQGDPDNLKTGKKRQVDPQGVSPERRDFVNVVDFDVALDSLKRYSGIVWDSGRINKVTNAVDAVDSIVTVLNRQATRHPLG